MAKKKVANLTFFKADNFGAVLQTYALQRFFVDTYGVDYRILNKYAKAEDKFYSNWSLSVDVGKAAKLKNDLMYRKYRKPFLDRRRKFREFRERFLNVTAPVGKNLDGSGYDFMVAGGDQIWNPRLYDFIPEFLLPFPFAGRKIAFAPSLGAASVTELADAMGGADRFGAIMKDFAVLSTREEQSARQLRAFEPSLDPVSFPDPVFLLPREEWAKMATHTDLPAEYVLFYDLSEHREAFAEARRASLELGLPLVSIGLPFKHFFYEKEVENIVDISPTDFVGAFLGAAFIVTTSFHGTAFSVLAQKPFISYAAHKDIRRSNLLAKYGFGDYVAPREAGSYRDVSAMSFAGAIEKVAGEKALVRKYLDPLLA